MSESTALGKRAFLTIFAGETVSAIGSGLSIFGVGIWLYQQTGSVTRFSLVSLCMILPSILFSPVAGVLVDRFDRRRIMIFANLSQCLIMLSFAPLIITGHLRPWYIYAAALVISALGMTNILAFTSLITRLLSGQDVDRASGLMQTITALAGIVSPLIAGFLLTAKGLQGIVVTDAFTFLFAMTAVVLVKIPSGQPASLPQQPAKQSPSFRDAGYGWAYVAARRGLLALLVFSAVMYFGIGLSSVTLTPLLLSVCSPKVVGTIAAIGALGMLIGSIGMGIWGGPKRRVHSVLAFGIIMGIGLVVTGTQISPIMIGIASFMIQLFAPVSFSSSQAIWLNKTPSDIQGRVFAVRTMVQSCCLPLAYLTGGAMGDRIFKPLLAPGGPLANTVGRVLGVGPSRGIGLMFVIVGVAMLIASVIGYLYSPLRDIDHGLPDVRSAAAVIPAEAVLTGAK